MNKPLAIFGAVAGAICAVLLTVDIPSFNGLVTIGGCPLNSKTVSISRDLLWSGNDAIEIRVPASVHFKVGPQWRAVVTGPAALVDHLRIRNGRIEFDRSRIGFCDAGLNVELTGPAVRQWMLAGSGDLLLEQLKQTDIDIKLAGSGSATITGEVQRTRASINGSGDLNLDGLMQTDIDLGIHGSGSATASGNAEHTRISIFGSGNARFGQLTVKDASIQINGSGNVDIAPEETAEVEINGSGNVQLLKNPKSVQTHVHGSGDVVSAS